MFMLLLPSDCTCVVDSPISVTGNENGRWKCKISQMFNLLSKMISLNLGSSLLLSLLLYSLKTVEVKISDFERVLSISFP